jgi:hypothetical protein
MVANKPCRVFQGILQGSKKQGWRSVSCSPGGVLSDGLLASQSSSGVKSVFAPKFNGLNNLANATFAAALRGVATFSSVAAFIGSAGQGSYAAANAAMDARLSEMQASGLPGRRLSEPDNI